MVLSGIEAKQPNSADKEWPLKFHRRKRKLGFASASHECVLRLQALFSQDEVLIAGFGWKGHADGGGRFLVRSHACYLGSPFHGGAPPPPVFLELFFCRLGSPKQAKTVDRGPVKEEHADMMLSAIVSPPQKMLHDVRAASPSSLTL
ncbi:unnamed protein product [Musa textilis]